MRYKGFYIKISPDSNIRRVDKKGNKILCEGFLIQIFADKNEQVEIDNFTACMYIIYDNDIHRFIYNNVYIPIIITNL